MYKEEEVYSIILVSGECFKIYKVLKTGSHAEFILLHSRDIKLQKHFKTGGQSSARFQRIVKSERESYVKKVVEKCVELLTKDDLPIIKGILLAGPADFKNRVSDYPEFKRLFERVYLGVVDTSEIVEGMVNQVYENNISIFNYQRDIKVLKQLDKIKDMICKDNFDYKKIIIGFEETQLNLEECKVKTLFITSNIDSNKNELIKKLNTYGCDINYVDHSLIINKLGVDIVGILFY